MPAPGTFLWLVAHDLRLNWRGFSGLFRGAGSTGAILVLGLCFAVLHLVAWPAVVWLSVAERADHHASVPLATGMTAAFMWMVAQSVFGTTRTLYDRADLDLLLGSPVPPARVVAAKAVAIMAGTIGSIALFVVPLANMGALVDHAGWLGIYPALLGLGLAATSIGLGVTLGLFLLVGPRRARIYSHMTGAALGGAFVLGAQVYAMLPDATIDSLSAWLDDVGLSRLAGPGTWAHLPVAAISGDIVAALTLVALGAALFAVTVAVLGPRFARAAMIARGAPAGGRERLDDGRGRRFRSGTANTLRVKEWRLLLRDPSLFAQLGLQIIYTIPVAVVLMRSNVVPVSFALVPTIVVIAAQVAGSISWLTVSGEDAPELIATAPVSGLAVDRAKLSAVALPVLVILGLPLAGLALASLYLAVVAFGFSVAAGASTALVNFWHPMPGNRRGMLRRHSQSKLIGLVEHGLSMLWAIAAVFVMVAPQLALVPLMMIAGVLGLMARSRPSVRMLARTPQAAHA